MLVAQESLVVVVLAVGFLQFHAQRPALRQEVDIAVLHGNNQFARGVERARFVDAVFVLYGIVAALAVFFQAAVGAGNQFVSLNIEHALKVLAVCVNDTGAIVLKVGIVAEGSHRDKCDFRAFLGKGGQAQGQRQQHKAQLFHKKSPYFYRMPILLL